MTGRQVRRAVVAATAVLAVSACSALTVPPQAHAREATGGEVGRLAREALGGDLRSLAELRKVDRVDGRAFELGEALGPGQPDARLRALAEDRPRHAPDAGAARGDARRLLAQERFHEPSIPRPLRGVFRWIGTTAAPVVAAVEDVIDDVASLAPGGRPVGLTLLAGIALLAFAAIASRTLRLRSRRRVASAGHERGRAGGPSPAELERSAAAAERAGDLSLAVRLRFRAGLLELERQGAISLRASLTTAAIERRLGSREFTAVATGFEEVAYGGRVAGPADVEAQRTGWRRVIEEVRA